MGRLVTEGVPADEIGVVFKVFDIYYKNATRHFDTARRRTTSEPPEDAFTDCLATAPSIPRRPATACRIPCRMRARPGK